MLSRCAGAAEIC